MKLTEHSLWNAPMEHRKFRAFPKLIFKTLKCNDHFSKFPFATLMKLTEHSLWNAPMEHRKFRAFPKLIFKTLKVVASHTHEFHTISRTCNRQLNRYPRPIFLTST